MMGVSGSGKTTVGRLLAARLGVAFADADAFHSAAAIATMAAGRPLTDDDRRPWLEAMAGWLADHRATGCVLACSALRRSHRDVLRTGAPDAWFLHLVGTPEVMTRRVAGRGGHFMPASLVDSQFATLEPPGADERAVEVDVDAAPDSIVTTFLTRLGDG